MGSLTPGAGGAVCSVMPTEKQYSVRRSLKYLWNNLLHLCRCSVEISARSYWSSLISWGVLGFKCKSFIFVLHYLACSKHSCWTWVSSAKHAARVLWVGYENLTYSKSLKKKNLLCQIIWHFLLGWAGWSWGWVAGFTGWRGGPVWTWWSAAWPSAKSPRLGQLPSHRLCDQWIESSPAEKNLWGFWWMRGWTCALAAQKSSCTLVCTHLEYYIQFWGLPR